MPWKFNPFSVTLDQTGSGGGGGAQYLDGEVATYNDLPLDGTAAADSAWLVRSASGTWLIGRKPAGIYIRTATGGSSRDADYTYAGIFPDVFSDANFTLYDDGDATKTAQFQLSGITTGQNRVLTVPDASGTIATTSQLTDTQIFTANGTWTKPAGAKYCDVELIGGGGGGGGGRRGATSTDRGGGGGGGGGGRVFLRLRAADLGATESVTVGAGGTGGATAADDTDGGAGGNGGSTSFAVLSALGGNGGAGGNATAIATRGLGSTFATFVSTDGASSTAGGNGGFGATPPVAGESSTFAPAGGGGGARITSANATSGSSGAGGAVQNGGGGVFTHQVLGGAVVLPGVGGANNGANLGHVGSGGSGGRFNSTGFVPAAGGNGGSGAGGGGGSAGLNASGGSTAGGNGGDGIAVITTYF